MLLVAVLLGLAAGDATHTGSDWRPLDRGIELRFLDPKEPGHTGDPRIAVVRIDPKSWALELVGRSGTAEKTGRTARAWAREHDLVLAINAGMFTEDYTTHVGYMESRGHVLSSGVNPYQSVAAFDPRDPENQPAFRIFDLDVPGVTLKTIRADYASLVQNLRLIKRPGVNRWSQQDAKWSEAALAEDEEGRVLFVMSRSPYSMHDLVRELLSAGIGVVAAQHLEGGRLAQLYLKVGDVELDLFEGSGGAFSGDSGSGRAWPIPNVIGVRRRPGVE